jgi:hypothetical protein
MRLNLLGGLQFWQLRLCIFSNNNWPNVSFNFQVMEAIVFHSVYNLSKFLKKIYIQPNLSGQKNRLILQQKIMQLADNETDVSNVWKIKEDWWYWILNIYSNLWFWVSDRLPLLQASHEGISDGVHLLIGSSFLKMQFCSFGLRLFLNLTVFWLLLPKDAYSKKSSVQLFWSDYLSSGGHLRSWNRI